MMRNLARLAFALCICPSASYSLCPAAARRPMHKHALSRARHVSTVTCKEDSTDKGEQVSEVISNVFFYTRAIVELAVDAAKAANTDGEDGDGPEQPAVAPAETAAAEVAAADPVAVEAAAAEVVAADAAAAKVPAVQETKVVRPAAWTPATTSPDVQRATLIAALNADLVKDSLDLKLGSCALRIASAKASGVEATLVNAVQARYDRAFKLQAVTAKKAS